MTRLWELASKYGTDKGPKGHGYTAHYVRHLEHHCKFLPRPCRLLEIGVHRGASLRMWADWMPTAQIVGVDIAPEDTVNTDRVTTVVSDFRDLPAAEWDIVIDDGSHRPADIADAWRQLWPQVVPGGWYVVEDVVQGAGPDVFAEIVGGIWSERNVAEVHVYPSQQIRRAGLNQAWQIIFAKKTGES